MTRAPSVAARLGPCASDGVLILDGAMGSELERRGVPMDAHAWCGLANLTAIDAVRAIHEENIAAGADVITTNTFMSGPGPMHRAGVGDRFAEGIRNAARAATQAVRSADRPVAIAGSVSCENWAEPRAGSRFRDDYALQIDLLAESGVDLIALEMVTDEPHGRPALEAALASGLPVWVGFSMRRAANAYETLPTIDEMRTVVGELIVPEIDAVTVMHTDVLDASDSLSMVRTLWDGPLGVYPHHGVWSEPNWTYLDMDPDELVSHARGWLAQGISILGVCCGLSARHVAALRAATGHIIAGETATERGER
jgi:S-methylmethionine-dependent homocysteine/selenocysteine methylase